MILLQAKGLAKSFGASQVFTDINFIINEGEKVGLVGANGSGKTTLFRCLTGEETLDQGEIMLSNKYSLGYLEQIPQYSPATTLLDAVLDMFTDIFMMREELRKLEQQMGQVQGSELERIMDRYSLLTQTYEEAGGFSCESKAKGIIRGLGFTDEDFNREINKFSGGEKTRVSLARLLVREPDLLLLDEPTNHLDLNALEWLEGFLKNYPKAVLVISHDRYFLDQVVTRVLELKEGRLKSFPGNYTKYLRLKTEQELSQTRAYEKQQKEIQKTQDYILRYKAGIKAKQARGREKQLNRLERVEKISREKAISLNIKRVKDTGKIVLEVENLQMAYGEKEVFSDVSFTVYQGEKIALIGGNGTGKSTILKIIAGKLQPKKGCLRLGSRVEMAYFDQEHANLDNRKKVIEEIMFNYNLSEGEARNKLAQVLFQGDDVFKQVGDLSGGEKARLSLLKIIMEQPNFLLLDEPTNHLDISSREIVESFLKDFPGTILLVSHDRYLLDIVTERTLELAEGKLTDYLGNFTYYKMKKIQLEKIKREKELKQDTQTKVKEKPKPKINKAKLRAEIELLEEEIMFKEEQMKLLSKELADPQTYQDEVKSKGKVEEFTKIEEELPLLYAEWEKKIRIIEEGNAGMQ